MRLEVKFVLLFLILAFSGSVINWAFYYGTLRINTEIYFPTDFQQDLLGIRFMVCLGLLCNIVSVFFERIWSKILSLGAISVVLAFYVLWYFEKFKWIAVVGVSEGTDEYANMISSIGWFREANWWDIFILGFDLLMLLWFICRFFSFQTRFTLK